MAHILLIEPDPILAKSYVQVIQTRNYSVKWVSDVQEAIYVSDQQRPDLVIMELQLAQHNGVEFLYEFRSYPEWQDIPVILLSMIPPVELKQLSVLWRELAISAHYYKPHTNLKTLLSGIAQQLTPISA